MVFGVFRLRRGPIPHYVHEAVLRAQRAALRPELREELGADYAEPSHIEELRASLDAENDRGCAIIIYAYIEDRLGELLRATFIDIEDDKATRELLSRGLGSYANRVNACFCLGLVPQMAYDDLRQVGGIRNEFGHRSSTVAFSTPEVRNLVNQLKLTTPLPENPRDQFVATAMMLVAFIDFKLAEAKHANQPDDLDREALAENEAEHGKRVQAALARVFERVPPGISSPRSYRGGQAMMAALQRVSKVFKKKKKPTG